MIWLFLSFDLLCYNITSYKTLFILTLFPFLKKKNIINIVSIGLIIDYLIIKNLIPINTIILLIVFFIDHYIIKLKKINFSNFLLINTFNLLIFVLLNYLLTNTFSFFKFSYLLFQFSLINFIIWVLGYNILVKIIKFIR